MKTIVMKALDAVTTLTAEQKSRPFYVGDAEDIAILIRRGAGAGNGVFKWYGSLDEFDTGAKGSWALDEGSGTTAIDSSSMGNFGTISGATYVPGKISYGLRFGEAANDQMATSYALDLTKDFTLAFWFKRREAFTDSAVPFSDKFNSYGAGKVILELRNYTDTGNNIRVRYSGSGDGHLIEFPTDLNVWNHFVWTHKAWNGTSHEYSVYKDGVLIETTNTTEQKTDTTDFNIGRAAASTRKFDIDEVRIYDRILSANEVKSLYERPKSLNGQEAIFTALNLVVDNATNVNTESITRVASKTLSAAGDAFLLVDSPIHLNWLQLSTTITTAGSHDAWIIKQVKE